MDAISEKSGKSACGVRSVLVWQLANTVAVRALHI